MGLVWAVAATPVQAGDWVTVESEHFVITTDGPQRKARDYVRRLEAFRRLGMLFLGADAADARARVPFSVHLLKSQDDMRKVRPEYSDNVAGVYFHCAEGSGAYSSLQHYQDTDGGDPGLQILFHEYAHHLMFQYARTMYPLWYVEGYAEYLSTAYVEDDKITLGHSSQARSWVLRQNRWIGFDRVLKPRFEHAGTAADEWEIQSFYAQSWLLAHYMLGDSERTRRFNAYFARIAAGEDPIAAFEPATGIAVGSLERTLKRYWGDMFEITVTLKDLPSAAPTVQALPDQAEDYVLSASLLRTCVSQSHGQGILAKLRALEARQASASPALRLALGRAEMLFGDAARAIDGLKALVAAEPTSFEAHYLLGRAWLKSAETLDGVARSSAMEQARGALMQAYRLKKLDAPNLYFLAQALSHGGVDANVVNAARGARALAPNVAAYGFYEAAVDLDAGDRDKAVSALMPLASNPHDPALAARARNAIAAIQAGKSRDDVHRALQGAD